MPATAFQTPAAIDVTRDRDEKQVNRTEDEVFGPVHRAVLRLAKRTVDPDLAADLTQEVMLVLLERYRDCAQAELVRLGERILKWRTWIHFRKRARRRALGEAGQVAFDGGDGDRFEPRAEAPSPEAEAIERERLRFVSLALGRLPAVYEEVLVQLLEGKTLVEIIQASGLPAGTIYARSSRGREALCRELRWLSELEDPAVAIEKRRVRAER